MMPLTEEDRLWFSNQMALMRTELLERIEKSETTLLTEFHQMALMRTELLERIEKSETTLLTEFHKWASPVELRQRSHSAAMRAFDAELEAVSDRVTKLEGPQSAKHGTN